MPNYTPIGTDLEAEELSALRKQRVAEMLMGQSMQPVQPFSKAGAYVTPMHWSQGLAQIAQALVAAKKGKSADAELKGIGDKRKQVADAAMSRFQAKSQGLPTTVRVDRLEGGSDVMGQKYMADPEGAAVELAGNAAVPQASRDAGVLQYQSGVRREEKADERTFRDEQARAAALARSDDLKARLESDAASRQQVAQIGADSRRDAAQIAADARRDAAAAAAEARRSTTMNAGQKAMDTQFGKDYADYVSGGAATIQKSLDELRVAATNLPTTQASGWILGAFPDFIRKRVAGPGFDIQQSIERNVQASLREVLGAQYTQKEGENLLARTFDPSLDESINKTRLDSLITSLERAKGEKDRAAEYFNANGTLDGFDGKTGWALGEFEPAADGSQTSGATQSAGGGRAVVSTGTHQGRKVVKYSDGTIEYADQP